MKTKDAIRLKLIDLMDERNVSGKDLASALGVSKQAVSSWRTGKSSIDLDRVPAICAYFGITLDEFFGSIDRPIDQSSLSIAERRLIEDFRKCDPQFQTAILVMITGYLDARAFKEEEACK